MEANRPPDLDVGERLGHYRIVRRIGEGGMGVVFEAHDEVLDRRVAVKLLRDDAADPKARERLVREARLAARVVHPSICQIHELGSAAAGPFIVMELVEGESMADRLRRGPMPPAEAITTAVALLEALAVLHARGIIHRDLKPSNVFLCPTGLKLLDFGLARPVIVPTDSTAEDLTAHGVFVGTPRYASPEQLLGETLDERSDLFSAAIITFELLSGQTPFQGTTLPALAHAILYDTQPVLGGSAAVAAVDRVLHRALAKSPADRYATAQPFATDLRSALALADGQHTVEARRILRLAVLPFRQLKPDPETDYLGPSLADALTSALSGFESLVVRSTLRSAPFAQLPLDLERVARDLAVDVVLTGTTLASQGRVRVSAELVAVPGGDVWWSRVLDTAPGAVLEVHDGMARQVLQALPLSARDREATPVTPRNDKAFDLYLRGMQLRGEASAWQQALTLFVRSSESDPGFADAWAERGRLERVLGKYEDPSALEAAEESFRRALAIDPEHGPTQHYYAQLEIDLGRVAHALDRLLARARQRRAEPHIFAALVHACRYGGLLDASVAAHETASRLDPTIATSVLHTFYMQGDFARAQREAHRASDPFEARLLGAMGRLDEARRAAREEEARFARVPMMGLFCRGLRHALDGDRAGTESTLALFERSSFSDGEALFYVAEIYAVAGLDARAHAMLTRAVDAGFCCLAAFERDPYFRALRGTREWAVLIERVRDTQAPVLEAFERGRGRAVLGA